MAFENGVNWQPSQPESRGRFRSFPDAVQAAFMGLYREGNPFFAQIVDKWASLFPNVRAKPIRFENNTLYLAVPNAPTSFVIRPKLASMKRLLAALPGAPARFSIKLEVRKC